LLFDTAVTVAAVAAATVAYYYLVKRFVIGN